MTALVTKHLPLVAGAPDGIKKLRGFILELAVRGKLTSQLESDEPAQTLLNKAREDKALSNLKGLARGSSSHESVTPPFLAPKGWVWTKKRDVLNFLNGYAFKSEWFRPDGIRLLRNVNIGHGFIGWAESVRISMARAAEFDAFSLRAGDVVLTLDRPIISTGLKVAVVRDADVPCLLLQRVAKISAYAECVATEYLSIWLNSSYFIGAIDPGRSNGVPHISTTQVGNMLFALPPLAEQHRIIAKVDELMALCDRLEADQADAAHAQLVQALLDSLTQATDAADFRASWQRLSEHFHTLFTTEASIDVLKQTVLQLAVMGKLVPQNPADESASIFLHRLDDARSKQSADNPIRARGGMGDSLEMAEPPYDAPVGWVWRNLGSILNITGGVTLGRKLAGRKLVSMPYLRVANVQRSYLLLDQIKHVEVPEDEVEKYKLRPNDLLITEGGDWDKVGRTAIWQNEIVDCLHQNHVFRARAPSEEFQVRWAELYLNAAPARYYFAGSSKQTTNLASINMTQLRACAFPIPPLAEQHRIVAKVDELMALCDQLKTQLAESRQLHAQLADALVSQAVA
jgi:type I restriction enzyme, S subunit